MIILGILLTRNFYQKDYSIIFREINFKEYMVLIIFSIVMLATIFTSVDTLSRFRYLKKLFRMKLESEPITLDGDVENKKMRNIYVFSASMVIFLFNLLDVISGNILITNSKFVLFQNDERIEQFCISLTMEIIISTLLLISINMKEIIKTLKSTDLYMILTDNEEIYCSCYLEYKNYYLIVKKEKKMERYISKSKVKEIRKIRNI